MIIKLRYGQPLLKVRVAQSGGHVFQSGSVDLIIREPVPEPGRCIRSTPWKLEGCWPNWRGPLPDGRPVPVPALMYRLFDYDGENLIFQLDGQINKLLPGRYIGTLVTRAGVVLDTLDFDLQNMPFIVDRVEVVEEVDCA